MSRAELLQCTAAKENRAFPSRPDRDLGPAKLVDIEGVDTFGRRQLIHARDVLVEERMYLGAGQVVDFDSHGREEWVCEA